MRPTSPDEPRARARLPGFPSTLRMFLSKDCGQPPGGGEAWGRRDLNPDQRVSSVAGSDPAALWNPGLIAPIGHHEVSKPVPIRPVTGARYSPRLNYVPTRSTKRGGPYESFSGDGRNLPGAYRCRIFCSRFRRRIRFLRHFQRIWPRFFHARELRFIGERGGRRGDPPLIFPGARREPSAGGSRERDRGRRRPYPQTSAPSNERRGRSRSLRPEDGPRLRRERTRWDSNPRQPD